ncbi:hypothetical protein P4E94_08820 [Pontiellaceae bacterium B12219]|nr:hypothetical protein [Pontiellaceae bacterium B12219]
MFKKQNKKPDAKEKQTGSDGLGCKAFQKLKDFQVDQYRMAVDENKWYMGERLNRMVDWEEAEEDFLHNGYYGCAPIWRKEYCADRCTHFATCGLGREFVKLTK